MSIGFKLIIFYHLFFFFFIWKLVVLCAQIKVRNTVHLFIYLDHYIKLNVINIFIKRAVSYFFYQSM